MSVVFWKENGAALVRLTSASARGRYDGHILLEGLVLVFSVLYHMPAWQGFILRTISIFQYASK